MVLFKGILNDVIHAARAYQNSEEQKVIRDRLNEDLFALAKKDSWEDLRRKMTITWDGTAVQLPSDLVGIDLVWDDDNAIEYIDRNRADAQQYEDAYRYFMYPVGDELATAENVRLNQDSTSMRSDTLALSGSTYVDEYMVVDGDPQVYEITAFNDATGIFTISPGYRGTGNTTTASVSVRPRGTQQLELTAPGNCVAPSGSVDIYYWQLPQMLRDDNDVVPLPTSDVLTYRSLSRLPITRKNRPISQAQVQGALDEALSMNADKPLPRVPRTLQGRRMSFANNHYRSLSGGSRSTLPGWQQAWLNRRT